MYATISYTWFKMNAIRISEWKIVVRKMYGLIKVGKNSGE